MNNQSNSTAVIDKFDTVINTFYASNYIDYVVRVLALLVHIIYIILIIKLKKLQSRTYIYLHHVNFVSFIYILHYVCYIGNRTVSTGGLETELELCFVSEFIWSDLKYLRTYSILLLAIYRYIAVSSINLYRKLNSSICLLITPITFTWIFASSMTLILRYSLNTSSSIFFCLPGYSDSILIIILNYCLVSLIANIIPISATVVIYVFILKKLKSNKKNLNRNRKVASNFKTKIITVGCSSSISSDRNDLDLPKIKKEENVKEIKFAKQFFIMNCLIVISSCISIVVDFQMILASHPSFNYLDTVFLDTRPIIRVSFLVVQSIIPMFSVLYNPETNLIYFFIHLIK